MDETLVADNFDREDEELATSSSGHTWTKVGEGTLGVVDNQLKLIS